MTQTTKATGSSAEAGRPGELRSLNPATNEVVGVFDVATDAEVKAALARAREAAQWWAGLSHRERGDYLLNWGAYLTRHSDELTELIHRENGKPVEDAYLELVLTLEHIHWAAKNAGKVLRTRSVAPGLLMA
ncbi:MAG: aldehyde dehydrogenase family protein, partial [Sciscionella sp.]